jgi:hypothetical protein
MEGRAKYIMGFKNFNLRKRQVRHGGNIGFNQYWSQPILNICKPIFLHLQTGFFLFCPSSFTYPELYSSRTNIIGEGNFYSAPLQFIPVLTTINIYGL